MVGPDHLLYLNSRSRYADDIIGPRAAVGRIGGKSVNA